MSFTWTDQLENKLIELRESGKTFTYIADLLNTTTSSVKHKYRRINQSKNNERYAHPIEKIEQIKRVLPKKGLHTLELHCGFGNLTKIYQSYGSVLSFDIEQNRVDEVNALMLQDVDAHKADSIREIHRYIWLNMKFDVVDCDPYGMPSRYFPHILELIDDGILFVTFPKLGVQQINKIMIEHYRVFWDFNLSQKANYKDIMISKIKDFGIQNYRSVQLIDCIELPKVYRFAFKVKKESALKIVGLQVNRKGVS